MDESVQELIDKTEKIDCNSGNPEYSTNWCDLPAEMRLECIKKMDFITRARLRATSHTEKSLVEAKKFHFDSVKLMHCDCISETLTLDAVSPFGKFYKQSVDDTNKTLNCAVQILKSCEIDSFEFSELDDFMDIPEFYEEMKKCAPFRFKNFKSKSIRPDAVLFFLRNCESVEYIELGNQKEYLFELTDFIDLPVVHNAKIIQFLWLFEIDILFKVVQKWIDFNAEVGKLLRIDFGVANLKAIDEFGDKFANRVIYKKDGEIRIRTDDESKHVLLTFLKDEILQFSPGFHSCTIIPSNLLESEYEKDEDWIDDVIYDFTMLDCDEDFNYHYRSELDDNDSNSSFEYSDPD